MVTVPGATAVTVPLHTVATAVLEEVQVMFLLTASAGWTVAVRVPVLPTSRVMVVWFRVTEETATGAAVTVTVQEPLTPLSATAVMVAVPALWAVTVPLLTLATLASEELQVRDLTVALEGAICTEMAPVLPASRLRPVRVRPVRFT